MHENERENVVKNKELPVTYGVWTIEIASDAVVLTFGLPYCIKCGPGII